MPPSLPAPWPALLDDTAALPPAPTSVADAVAAHRDHHQEWYAPLLRSLVVPDTALGEVPTDLPATVVVTGGAGALGRVLQQAQRAPRRLAGVAIALRDPDDLPGNARRVVTALDAAEDEGLRTDDLPVHVELPATRAHHGWLAAVDVLAERELPVLFRLGGPDPGATPGPASLATWMEAALDRETAYACTGAGGHAISVPGADGAVQYGLVNVLLATREAFDGAGADAVADWLAETDAERLRTRWAEQGDLMAGAGRWCPAYGVERVAGLTEELVGLGLLSGP